MCVMASLIDRVAYTVCDKEKFATQKYIFYFFESVLGYPKGKNKIFTKSAQKRLSLRKKRTTK